MRLILVFVLAVFAAGCSESQSAISPASATASVPEKAPENPFEQIKVEHPVNAGDIIEASPGAYTNVHIISLSKESKKDKVGDDCYLSHKGDSRYDSYYNQELIALERTETGVLAEVTRFMTERIEKNSFYNPCPIGAVVALHDVEFEYIGKSTPNFNVTVRAKDKEAAEKHIALHLQGEHPTK